MVYQVVYYIQRIIFCEKIKKKIKKNKMFFYFFLFINILVHKILVHKILVHKVEATVTSFEIVLMMRFSPESGIGVQT